MGVAYGEEGRVVIGTVQIVVFCPDQEKSTYGEEGRVVIGTVQIVVFCPDQEKSKMT